MKLKKLFGPSTLVAAAFIGPGTVTTCTIAGVTSGYTMLWSMLFSITATIVLQEMSARLGWATGRGLGEAIRTQFDSGIGKYLSAFLVIAAILIGNAAYEAGNLSGGILGLQLIVGESGLWPILVALLSFILLYSGNYKFIERLLVTLVIIMSLSFLITAAIVKPNFTAVMQGFMPTKLDSSNILLFLGLLGTTVVPYNLFLHASTISKKYSQADKLSDIKLENYTSILLGGIISMLIIITAAATAQNVTEVKSAADLATQLEPVFGSSAKYLMGIGLMAAGCSSALTAPLAAAYAAKGLFGWQDGEKNWRFRMTWMTVLLLGTLVLLTGVKPIPVIKFAQITNAILLPFIAIFLIKISNDKKLLGKYVNKSHQNILAILIIIVTIFLGLKTLNNFIEIF